MYCRYTQLKLLFPLLLLLCLTATYTATAFESVVQNDLSNELKFGDQNVYVPKALEVRGGSRNINIHGIYLRDDTVLSQMANDPSQLTYRPAFKRIHSPRQEDLYLLWIDVPTQQWVISTQSEVPHAPPNGVLLAKFQSLATSPAFSRSWKVRGRFGADGTGENEQLPSSALKTHALQTIAAAVAKSTKTGKMGWKTDVDFIVDEARPGTYSTLSGGQKEMGCPNPSSSSTLGVQGYKMDPCRPPAKEKVKGTHRLDYHISGGDGMMRDTLFSWDGYFMSRPYFTVRSSANPHPTNNVSSTDGRQRYMWADGVLGQLPVWRITREIGNIHEGQVMATWKPDAKSNAVVADWPAEVAMELSPRDWVMSKKFSAADVQGTNEQQRVVLWTKGVEVQTSKVVVSGSNLGQLNGVYYHMGDYLGDPFFRQAFSGGNGLVMYRGRVVAADMDTWVIGSRLGATAGIQAFVESPKSRWPHVEKNTWHTWNSHTNTWLANEGLAVDFQYVDAKSKVAELFGSCPLPTCESTLEVHCPPEGTCNDCVCQSTGQRVEVPSAAIDPYANQLASAMHGAEVLRKLEAPTQGVTSFGYDVASMIVDPLDVNRAGLPSQQSAGAAEGEGMSMYRVMLWSLLIIPLAAVTSYGIVYVMKQQNTASKQAAPVSHYSASDVAHAAAEVRRRSKHRS